MADIGQKFTSKDTTDEVIRIFRFRAAAEQKEDVLERGNGVRVNSRGRRTSDYHHSSRYRGDDETERGKWEKGQGGVKVSRLSQVLTETTGEALV